MNKRITIDYEEYLELINLKQQYEQDIENIKKLNNYDILLSFVEDYERIFKYSDVQIKKYGKNDWREITLPLFEIYEECTKRIKEKILRSDNNEK